MASSRQASFAQVEWSGRKRRTARARFIEQMDSVVPWAGLVAIVEPHRPSADRRGRQPDGVPDATTLAGFRHLVERESLDGAIFAAVVARLEAAGLMMHGGSVVDATIVSVPSSTKNRAGERDPEMHQTKKGNQWYHESYYWYRDLIAGQAGSKA